MELYILPVLALLGLVFLFDTSGDDDDDTDTPDTPDPDARNFMPFGDGDDVSGGTDANDAMYLGIGDDTANGGAGDDRIFFGDDQDATVKLDENGGFSTDGMEGDDFIRGSDGRDILVDALGSNTIYGDVGYDRMNSIDAEGDEGTFDTMYGGFGEDVLFADDGDVLSGGGQDDRFQILATEGMTPVTITDFSQGDTFFLRDAQGGFQNIERITTEIAENGEDTNVLLDGAVVSVLQGVTTLPADAIGNPVAPPMYGEVERDEDGNILRDELGNVVNDDFDDDIVINDYASTVFGLGGDDTISFDENTNSADRDMVINGGTGDDTILAGLGNDVLNGGLGNDELLGGGGTDEIYGGFGDDTIDSTDINFRDGPNEDALEGDLVFGGAGDDEITFDALDAVSGDAGVDSFVHLNRGGDPGLTSINDFDPDLEKIVIQSDVIGSPLVYTDLSDGSGAYVVLEGVPILYLVGVTAAQAQVADITLIPS